MLDEVDEAVEEAAIESGDPEVEVAAENLEETVEEGEATMV